MDTDSGRSQQKYRTRRALLAAARALLERKEQVTVTAAAAEAMISKATAYRYFATSDALMREAALDGYWLSPEDVIGDASEVRERVRRVNAYLFAHTRRHESAHRYFLAKALEAWVAEGGKPKSQLRLGRRLPMYELALEPLRTSMSKAAFRHLVLCLAGASGIESYIALKDMCQLDDAMADEISWSIIGAILDKAGIARRGLSLAVIRVLSAGAGLGAQVLHP
jgi:AcrR family transcriptional regulator